MSRDTLLRPKIVSRTDRVTTGVDLALELFIAAKKGQRLSPRTVQNYRYVLGKFIQWLKDRGVHEVGAVTPHHIRLFIAELTDQGMTAWSVHDHARPIKTWMRFLQEDGLISTNPMEKVVMPKLDKPILPALTPDELRKLLRACQDERDKALLHLMLDTGVRAQELCALRISDLDVHTGTMIVKAGKGGKGRAVFLASKALRHVLRYLATRPGVTPDTPLFPSQTTGQALKPNGLLLWLRRLGKRAGVKVSPHALRRTFALLSLRSGTDLITLQRLMGHTSLDILRQYLAQEREDLREVHMAHSPADRWL
jgi:integrase/recombinase XerD